MIIRYNIDKIREFIWHFYNVSKLPTSIWDQDMNQMAFHPDKMIDFCSMIKSSPLGNKRCLESDKCICSKARISMKPEEHLCHAGLYDTAIPLINEDTVYGYLMFGQGKDPSQPPADREYFEKLGEELQLPPDELYEAYNRLPVLNRDIINSSFHILEAAIPYLFSSSYIKFTENELVGQIDAYIEKNIAEKIMAKDICFEFGLSKSKLYSLWDHWHGTTIGNYILNKRMKIAKKMLINSDENISKICANVGIPDYNYFSKVFKKYYGVPPKQYRSQFPHILENQRNRKDKKVR